MNTKDKNIKFIIFIAILFFGLFSLAGSSWAADHYIRAGATGANNGTSWTDAWTQLPGTLTRGDTYYIADGTYTAYTFDDPVSGTELITVKKATLTDHGVNAGWQDSYGDGVADWTPIMIFKTDYMKFDGVTGGGPGDWSSGYGFRIASDNNTDFVLFSDKYGAPSDRVDVRNIMISHVELDGHAPVTPGWGDGFNATTYQANTSNVTISYCYVHDMGDAQFIWSNVDNITVEYCYIARNASNSDHHGTGFRIDDARGLILRHNIFEDLVGTGYVGGYDIGIDDVKIYGNVFWWTPDFHGETNIVSPGYGNGVIYSVGASGLITNWKIYNNSFINLPDKPVINLYNTGSGNEAYNNIFDTIAGSSPVFCGSATGENPSCIYDTISHDYSYFSNTNRTFSDAHSQNGGTNDPFMDWHNMDFRLNYSTLAGVSLGVSYVADAYGNVRGGDGYWDVGAYEYFSGGSDIIAPASPSGLSVR